MAVSAITRWSLRALVPVAAIAALLLGASTTSADTGDTPRSSIMAPVGDGPLPPSPPPWVDTVPVAAAAGDDDPKPGFLETSEYMIGSVAVGVIFLESDGSLDPSSEDWTPEQQDFAMRKLQTALDWWVAQEPASKLSFVVERAETSVPIGYEPIKRSGARGSDKALWIGQAMERKGFRAEDFAHWRGLTYLGQVYDYVNDLRNRKKTDWAFAVFFVNDAHDPDYAFGGTDPSLSFAALSGPYLVGLFTNGSWGTERLDLVLAHEMGHVFGATDTYNNESETGGYFNAPDVDGRFGLMNRSDLFLPDDTRLQIGWRDRDGDGILDPLDTDPYVELVPFGQDPTDASTLTFTGQAVEVPLPNRNHYGRRSVSLNTIRSVEYRLDDGPWRVATAPNGDFTQGIESFSVQLNDVPIGRHRLEVRAVNSVGNTSPAMASGAFLVTHILVSDVSVSARRADVGSVQEVRIGLTWAHDNSAVTGGTVALGSGEPVPIPATGTVTFPVTSDEPGRQTWMVQARSGNIRKTVVKGGAPAIIWDRIQVTGLEVADERVDAGTSQSLLARAQLEYDGTPLGEGDTLLINGVPAQWDATAQAFRLVHREPSVSQLTFQVTGANQVLYGISGFRDVTGARSIIWDRVKVMLDTPRRRVDVGTELPMTVSAIYEFDGSPFDGQVVLNAPLRRDEVGMQELAAAEVTGSSHGISELFSDRVPVVWDRVDVTLRPALERVEAGTKARLEWTAHYAYDGTPFEGEVAFDALLTQEEPGRREYRVADVSDRRHALQAFATNATAVTFDRIVVQTRPSVWRPGRLTVGVEARYETDGAPVTAVNGSVNGVALTGAEAGFFVASVGAWLPRATYETSLVKDGFAPVTQRETVVLWGNVLVLATGAPVLGSIGAWAIRRRRPE